MNYTELDAAVRKTNWFHSITIPFDTVPGHRGTITTPGRMDYCNDEAATKRFGIPERLTGATILDVGAWDGYFTFLAEERGAHTLVAIDTLQDCSGIKHTNDGFALAARERKSKATFHQTDLKGYRRMITEGKALVCDVAFYFGVLYHTDDPFAQLQYLRQVTRWYALIETACIHVKALYRPKAYWDLRPGYNGDATNRWYPTIPALIKACTAVGFQNIEVVHVSEDRTRCTIKAFC